MIKSNFTIRKIQSSILLFLMYCNCSAQSWENVFDAAYAYPVGPTSTNRSPILAKEKDFDRDGDIDIVIVRNNASSGFSFFKNDGQGHFSFRGEFPASLPSFDLDIADFNNDSFPDVVVTNTNVNFSGNTVSVFLNLNGTTFSSPSSYSVGNGPVGVTCADFNMDGFIDIATANNAFSTGTSISILLSNGTGGFNAAQSFNAGLAPYKIKSGDLNGDNYPDLVVANELQTVHVLMNTHPGFNTINLATGFPASSSDYFPNLNLIDLDLDNDLDICYTTQNMADVVFFENANGVILSPQTIGPGSTPSFVFADINQDGGLDMISASANGSASDGIKICTGNGIHFSPTQVYSAGQYTSCVLATDVDGDSDIDVVTVDNYSLELTVHLNFGFGLLSNVIRFVQGFPNISTKLEVADINNDGYVDIATSADSRTAVNVPVAFSLNDGNGNYNTVQSVTSPGFGGLGVKLRDINGDGYKDLVFASGINTTPYDFFTALNNGNGTFATLHRWPVNSCGWNDIETADLDADGDLDVIITEWLGCPSEPNSGRRIYLNWNDGSGNFGTPQILLGNAGTGPLAICDFDEDGDLDIATGQTSAIDIHFNNGNGNFSAPVSLPMSSALYDIIAIDLTGDGHADLASCNYGANPGDYNVTIRLGNGNGTFQPTQLIAGTYSPSLANVSGLTAGDIDNDGDVDLLTGQNASNNVLVMLNNGNGTFTKVGSVGISYSVRSPKLADVDNDGKTDLLSLIALPISGIGSGLGILKGKHTGIINEIQTESLSCSQGDLLSIQATESAAHFIIYPNPSSGFIKIKSIDQTPVREIRIYSFTGELVYTQQNLPAEELNLKAIGLKNGIYKLQLYSINKAISKTVVLRTEY